MPEIWLLDFDNTIARLEPEVDWVHSRVALEEVLRDLGCETDIFTEIPKRNLPLYSALMGRLRESADAPRSRILLEAASSSIERFELAGVDRAAPLDGALELLQSLAEREKPRAIVTSNSANVVRRWLTRQGLDTTIELIVGRDSLLELKPSHEILHRALSTLQSGRHATDASHETVVMVGDSIADLHAARSARKGFFAVGHNPATTQALQEGELHFSTLRQLIEFLEL
jgi:phosphoglycolate phosphatase-like HAD superfamily hydrolase